MRIALGIEYDGGGFRGWQSQRHDARTVQDCVEGAVSRVADHPVSVVAAGRTDTGVHALGQVVHFDSPAPREPHQWLLGCNANLPPDVSVLWARAVRPDFHARLSAIGRRYRYKVLNRSVRPALERQHVCWWRRPLDVPAMREAAGALVGEHDFTAYRAAACQARNPVRTIYRLDVYRRDPHVWLDVWANAFLHHMVRNIAGVLLAIGSGDQRPEWAASLLETRDRTLAAPTASAAGLYLAEVRYPAGYGVSGAPG